MVWIKHSIKYFSGKIIKLIVLLVAVSVLSFILVSNSPIDPVQSYIGADLTRVSPEQRENIAEYWGLNDSPVQRFFNWGKNILHGDLGTCLIFRSQVADVIMERFTASIALMSVAWVLSGLLGYALGIIAGMNENTWIDKVIKAYCFTLASTPAFWLGWCSLCSFPYGSVGCLSD